MVGWHRRGVISPPRHRGERAQVVLRKRVDGNPERGSGEATSVRSAVRPPVSIGAAIPTCRPRSTGTGFTGIFSTVPTRLSVAFLAPI